MFRQFIRVKMHAGTLYRGLVTQVKPKSMVHVKSDSDFANSSAKSDKKSRKVAKSDLFNLYEKDTRQMLRKSSSKKLQQKLFSENVLAPKPLSGIQTNPIWNPYYFRDLGSVQQIQPNDKPTSNNALSASNVATNTQVSKMQQALADLERTLRSSVSKDEQERYLTVVIQTSGYGKTHLAHQYCLQHRALLMQFLTSSSSSLVHQLEAFITEQRDELKISSSLADHPTELKFTTIAFQSTSLLPLTFIEFAYQYFKYAPKYSKKEQWNEALLRTLNSGSYDLIGDMFSKNLKKYATNGAKFAGFKQRMYAAAKSMKLEAMIYDEIFVFEKLKGMFLHHPFNEPTAYARLKEERDHIHRGSQLNDSPYSQITSILYMLRLAMEDLVKEAGIPQLILSTHYSAAKFELPQVGVSARDRLKVQKFCWTESTDERWNRFHNELRTTLNFNEHKEVEAKIVSTLKPFAVRAVYLWPFWITLSRYMSRKQSFEEIVSKSLEVHKALVANRIKQYADALMEFKDQQWRDRFLLQVAVGRRYISDTQKDLNNLIQIGLIAVPEGLESLMQGINDTKRVMIPLNDPFTVHYLEAKARQQFDRLVRKSAKWSIDVNGLFAEVAVFALLRQFKGKTLKALVKPGLGLEDNTLLDLFTIDECVTLRDYLDLSLANQNNFLPNLAVRPRDFVLSPSKSFFHTSSECEQHTREHTFVVGLTPSSDVDAIVCIRSEFYSIITPSVAHAAIASLDPNNFYSRDVKLRASWEDMKRTVTKPHYWIRVIIGKAVTHSVVEAIAKHNRANPYQPILMVIPDLYIHEEADRLQFLNEMRLANQLPAGALNDQALQLTRYFDSTILNESDLNKLDPAGSGSSSQ